MFVVDVQQRLEELSERIALLRGYL